MAVVFFSYIWTGQSIFKNERRTLPTKSRRSGSCPGGAIPTHVLEIVVVGVLLLDTPTAEANGTVGEDRESALAVRVISRARRLALRRLAQVAECRALFESLGDNGSQLVADATFRLAGPRELSQICRRRKAIMFTTLHGSEITLCMYNLRIQPLRAQAALLLHEALHHAGLTEQPADPEGMSPDAITRLVERKCNL